ncbi:hypothetical protein BC477_02510 [Clavibacter michiganensis subsp. michiganensis]|uniref:Uncharacterized protein n=2 Tax=Clavibacter michiganensis subsp. michiganensis TaxID=33013 RepID=A0A251XJ85_CLAMM|nr:hypothetical protein [Clavibacter michiganensis]OUD86839.1 hypothetical protein BC477_02510 [Clavibacter michiganensis subsp. michiganensis]OUE03582.1 hypothetical protein CMMCAS07_01445 [Clavibacter michiganensis subsp. michiganensis]CAN02361.1 hypothetical protein CMM_2289 [Clavibacter michiganensis subsp. michiganensis NCPPB 382]
MTTTTFYNPILEDDDYDETAPVIREPKFGEKGFGKGKPHPHKGTPRAKVNTTDAQILAFLNEIQVADTATISMIYKTLPSRVSVGGRIPTVGGTNDKMKRLLKMGLVQTCVSRDDRSTVLWGVTEAGIAAARNFGYLLEDSQPNHYVLKEMKRVRQNHFRGIGMVAAHFIAGTYKAELGLGPISVTQIVGEPRMRREHEMVWRRLVAADKEGASFGRYRMKTMSDAYAQYKAGDLAASDVLEKYPELRTLGKPITGVASPTYKDAHPVDLAIDLDHDRTKMKSKSILVEVELSNKQWADLKLIIATIADEVKLGMIYERAVYFTHSPYIKKRIEKVDSDGKFGLIESGKLVILPIVDRFHTPFEIKDNIAD